jgi:hypothetical protein
LAYWLHISDPEKAYLDGLPLSDMAKDRVNDFIEYAIKQVDDAFRQDPANRTQPDTRYFNRQMLLFDFWGDQRFHLLDFYISDEHASSGILLLAYVDHQ